MKRTLLALALAAILCAAYSCGSGKTGLSPDVRAVSHPAASQAPGSSQPARSAAPAQEPARQPVVEPWLSLERPAQFGADEGLAVTSGSVSVEFFALDGSDQPSKADLAAYDVRLSTDTSDHYILSVCLKRPLPSGRAFFLLRYDATKIAPEAFREADALAGSAISLAVLDRPGFVPAGVATVGKTPAPLPSGPLCTLTLSQHSAGGRKVSSVPTGPDNAPADIVVTAQLDGSVTLTLKERNVGDYNFDGQVGIADLGPVAQYYGTQTSTLTVGDPPYWADGNRDGEVGIGDLAPIAANYGVWLAGYNVYRDGLTNPLLNPGEPNPANPTLPTVLRPTAAQLQSRVPPVPTDLPYPYFFTDYPSHVARTIVYTLKAVAPLPPPQVGLEEGASADAAPLDYQGDTIPPAAPQGLVATAGNSHVSLTWTANTEQDLAGYDVYYSTTPSDPSPTKANSSLLTVTTLDVTSLTNGTPYYFRVTASDDNVPPNTSGYSQELSATPVNQLPHAAAQADVTYGLIPLTVNFTSTGSSDPDGTIATYEWDFDYDGTTFTTDSTEQSTQYVYKTIGTSTVALRVTDDQGGQDMTTLTVMRVSPLAFTSNKTGVAQIYLINSDGTNRTQVTSSASDVHGFNFSHDGTKIVYWSANGGSSDNVFTIGVDGTGVQQLTTLGGNDSAVFSPDDTKIAFVSNRDGDLEVYTMNADGSAQTDVTNQHGGGMVKVSDFAPAWSPDGTKIAFVSNRDVTSNIFAMNTDGSGQTDLTNTADAAVVNVNPKWSADGLWIFFNTTRDGNYEVYKMDATGNNLANVTNSSPRDEKDFDLAPDLSIMVLESNRLGTGAYFNIYSEILATGGFSGLTFDSTMNNYRPRLSPDGTRVVFVTNQVTYQNVRMIWSDGSHKTWITNELTTYDDMATWKPAKLN